MSTSSDLGFKTTCNALGHSCWRASFLAFCLGGRPAIYTIYIPYISLIYSMYISNYMHIWRATRNVKITPANNYALGCIYPTIDAFDMYTAAIHSRERACVRGPFHLGVSRISYYLFLIKFNGLWLVLPFSKFKNTFFGYFDPEIFFYR